MLRPVGRKRGQHHLLGEQGKHGEDNRSSSDGGSSGSGGARRSSRPSGDLTELFDSALDGRSVATDVNATRGARRHTLLDMDPSARTRLDLVDSFAAFADDATETGLRTLHHLDQGLGRRGEQRHWVCGRSGMSSSIGGGVKAPIGHDVLQERAGLSQGAVIASHSDPPVTCLLSSCRGRLFLMDLHFHPTPRLYLFDRMTMSANDPTDQLLWAEDVGGEDGAIHHVNRCSPLFEDESDHLLSCLDL
jgi:hypothetical protein